MEIPPAIRVYPSRLSGVTLEDDAVRFYSTNEQGDRSAHSGGSDRRHAYIRRAHLRQGDQLRHDPEGNYTLDSAGTAIPIVSTNTVYGVHKGACQVIGSTKDPDRIRNLSEVALDSVSSTTAISSSNQKYPVSEQAWPLINPQRQLLLFQPLPCKWRRLHPHRLL